MTLMTQQQRSSDSDIAITIVSRSLIDAGSGIILVVGEARMIHLKK
jgi:hypothetical protein